MITAEQNRDMRSEGCLVSWTSDRAITEGGSCKHQRMAQQPSDWLFPPSNRREARVGTTTILELCGYPGVD